MKTIVYRSTSASVQAVKFASAIGEFICYELERLGKKSAVKMVSGRTFNNIKNKFYSGMWGG